MEVTLKFPGGLAFFDGQKYFKSMEEQKHVREWGKDRTEKVTVRFTEAERKKLEALAEEQGLTLAEFIRMRSFPGRVHIRETSGRVVSERQ